LVVVWRTIESASEWRRVVESVQEREWVQGSVRVEESELERESVQEEAKKALESVKEGEKVRERVQEKVQKDHWRKFTGIGRGRFRVPAEVIRLIRMERVQKPGMFGTMIDHFSGVSVVVIIFAIGRVDEDKEDGTILHLITDWLSKSSVRMAGESERDWGRERRKGREEEGKKGGKDGGMVGREGKKGGRKEGIQVSNFEGKERWEIGKDVRGRWRNY
jgi:hypothetical protein